MTLSIEAFDPSDRRGLGRFVNFPYRLMRGDPAWRPPLRLERREALSPAHNPFFQHAEVRYWIAVRNGRDVGRISAQADRLQPGPRGHFGLLAAEDDPAVFAALTGAAEHWLRSRGVSEVLGPFNLSVNEEVGLLVDGFDTPPMVMMGHDPPYAGGRLEALGYVKAKDLYAYKRNLRDELPAPLRSRLARGAAPGVRLRPLDIRRFGREVETMASIFNDAWAGNWGFTPWTEAETRHVAASLRPVLDRRLVWFAEVGSETAGFVVALPNLNEAARDLDGRLLPFGWAKLLWRLKVRGVRSVRVPLMGVRPAFARAPGGALLPLMLINAALEAGRRAGYQEVEVSWVLEDNRPMNHIAQALGSERYKTYRVYRKPL